MMNLIEEHAPFLDETEVTPSGDLRSTQRANTADRALYCASTVSDACVRACLEYIPSEKLFGTLVEKTLFRVASQRL
ncbi:MAG: hypothetical protein AB7S81_02845, partial [Bdellovibrionales bacterium]